MEEYTIEGINGGIVREPFDSTGCFPTEIADKECLNCHGAKQLWNSDIKMMEDCDICQGEGELPVIILCDKPYDFVDRKGIDINYNRDAYNDYNAD